MVYNNTEGSMGKYIVQDLHDPHMGTPEFQEMYRRFSHRILWIDDKVVPGSFQMNTAWYYAVPEKDPVFEEHQHDDDEIIGFFGSNPDDPYDLGAEILVTLDGEEHLLTRSSLIFCPAGMKHMRLSIKKVDRPVFHFSVVTGGEYNGAAYK